MIPNNILLLEIIRKDLELTELESRGLLPSQIMLLIKKAEKDGMLIIQGFNLSLSDKGEELLNSYYYQNHICGEKRWLRRSDEYFKKPQSEDYVFLPKKV